MDEIQAKIQEIVASDKVVLFMKGSPKFPQCGFSNLATQILDACETPYTAVDVLADNNIREGVKVFSNWPTIPQLYVNGEFVGGSDIMRSMYDNGELKTLVSA